MELHHTEDDAREDALASPPAGIVGRPRIGALLGALGTLYVSFGVLFGLVQGGLPPLLRSRGLDLGQIGWTFAILLPFGLTFLWSPLVDAIRPMRRAPRIGWIIAAQSVVVVCLFVVAENPSAQPQWLLLLGLVVAFAAATMDVALDALASSAVPDEYRPLAGAMKVGALSVGMIIGGGVLVSLAQQLGWPTLFRAVAIITVIATLPILFCRSWDQPNNLSASTRPRVIDTFGRHGNGRRLLALTSLSCVLVSLISLNRIMLVDLGVSIEQIGAIVGLLSPAAGVGASILAVPLLRTFGSGIGLLTFTGFCIAAVATMAAGAHAMNTSIAIAGAIAVNAGVSGLYVILCAAILGWAQGRQPATDYATLYGASRFAATVALMALSRTVPLLGWPAFYALAACALVIVSIITVGLLPESFSLKRHKPQIADAA